jgi:hypothetical protein
MSRKVKVHRTGNDDEDNLLRIVERGKVGDIIDISPGNQMGAKTLKIVLKEQVDEDGNLVKDQNSNPIMVKGYETLYAVADEMDMYNLSDKSRGLNKRKSKKSKRNKSKRRKGKKHTNKRRNK